MCMPCCPWSHGGCGQKCFKLVWWCHQLLSELLAKGHLSRVLRQSCRSLMKRVITLMKRVIMKLSGGLCTDLLAFALKLRRTPENSARRPSDWTTSRRLKWGPFLPNEVGRIAQHVRKGEGRKEGHDGMDINVHAKKENAFDMLLNCLFLLMENPVFYYSCDLNSSSSFI